VDPIADLDDLEKRKFFTLPGLESGPSVFQPVAIRYYRLHYPGFFSLKVGRDSNTKV
jgi:hypothetical protein